MKTNSDYSSSSRSRALWKKLTVAAIVAIILASFAVTYIFQESSEASVKSAIFDHEREKQAEAVKLLSQHIGSDITGLTLRLQGIANSPPFQYGDFQSQSARELLEENFSEIDGIVDRLGVIGADGLTKANIVARGQDDLVGKESATASIVFQSTKQTLAPYYSEGYVGLDGQYRIVIGQPVINRESREFLGVLAVTMPTATFFERYGNIHDVSNQYVAAMDMEGNYLATALPGFVGKNFYSEEVQNEIGHNEAVNALVDSVVKEGKPDVVIADFGVGERLATSYPVYAGGKQAYSVFIVTPTASIYSQINDVLFVDRIQNFLMLGVIAASLIVIILVLTKWNSSLHLLVRARTMELELASEQLKAHDNMQREFINVAAHEIRTPVQPILGMADILESQIQNGEDSINVGKDELAIISRNAKRLERLTGEVLEVARIESDNLQLNKAVFDPASLVESVVEDARASLPRLPTDSIQEPSHPAKIVIKNNIPQSDPMSKVEADREKIKRVLYNLLDNALKFSPADGTVFITLDSTHAENGSNRYATITIRDEGTGIHPDIMPRLFTKFASKSENGTGLGLFISKSIVEAHGGEIFAENNKDGRGATFWFTLPMKAASTAVIEE